MMDLKDLLTGAAIHLKKEEIGTLIGPDPAHFKQLLHLAFSREMPVCWRATWIMDYLAELHPWIAEPHIEKIWKEIPEGHPDGVTRSALRLVCRYEIPVDTEGIAADICLDWLGKESVPVAIKVYSMEILLKIAKDYPELAGELITVLEEQAPKNSTGFKARARHVTEALRKL